MGTQAWTVPLDRGWRFGGPTSAGATRPGFDDGAFARVTLPHANATLPWRDLDRSRYQYVAIYRRHFAPPAAWRGRRVFVEFDGAMAAATVTLNGHRFAEHRGGYTPFLHELTDHLDWSGDNVLAVEVDARRSRADFPPFGGRFPDGRERLDYDTFGGIGRGARLRAVPATFIENVRATPFGVLTAAPGLALRCFLDGDRADDRLTIAAELRDGDQILGHAAAPVAAGEATIDLAIGDLAGVRRWDVDAPHLYDLVVTLREGDTPVQDYRARVGFREASFEPDGFFLNGRRVQLVGLNRHELFPHVGGAMPPRVQRRDAEIVRREFGCNMVRTAHYPQSPAFLDACDELGLLVWEELPGWQHVGDAGWRAVAAEHARAMIRRDWSRPSVVLWGVRINESAHDESEFFDALHRLARELDPSRQTVGAYNKREHQRRTDVWGENDYGLHGEPLGPPHQSPYLISEAVGQKRPGGGFDQFYRRADPDRTLQLQAERHAAVHDAAAGDPRHAGVLAWCAFDYNSPFNGDAGVKTPGVADLFRIPKAAGGFYRSQRPPDEEIVLEPAFGWGGESGDPTDGPGAGAMICANCDRLELFVGGAHVATALPARARFPHLAHPPFFVDLTADGAALPELRIDGYLGDRMAISRRFSADPAEDRLCLAADDDELLGDGGDATRLFFGVFDRHGNPRARATGAIDLTIAGPGAIVGDNPFDLGPAGGSGAVWVRTVEGGSGPLRVRARHPTLGEAEATIAVAPAPPAVV